MKNKLFFFILLFSLINFTGCETKVESVLHQSNKQITIIKNTQRGQIVDSLETIAMINATYLNPILSENNKTAERNEIFVIGVYNDNDIKGYDKGGIHNPNYILTMNGSNYEKAEKVDIKKMQIVNYPFYNQWMKYYIVYFPKSDKNVLKLVYRNREFGRTMLIFRRN